MRVPDRGVPHRGATAYCAAASNSSEGMLSVCRIYLDGRPEMVSVLRGTSSASETKGWPR